MLRECRIECVSEKICVGIEFMFQKNLLARVYVPKKEFMFHKKNISSRNGLDDVLRRKCGGCGADPENPGVPHKCVWWMVQEPLSIHGARCKQRKNKSKVVKKYVKNMYKRMSCDTHAYT